jgi:hypothetical protein
VLRSSVDPHGPEPVGPGPAAGPGPEASRGIFGSLFPLAPAKPRTAGRPVAARWAEPLLAAVALLAGTLLQLARIPGTPAWDSLHAEDGSLFLPAALAYPWHLLTAYGGYLELAPRLVAQVIALLPVRYASAAFAAAGALAASACALFVYHAGAGHVRNRWLRALLALSVVLLPVAPLEVIDTGVSIPWYLLPALFWASIWRPVTGRGRALAGLIGFATAASLPLAFLLAPLLAARMLAVPRRIREHAVTLGWVLGCALQATVIATSHQSRMGELSSSSAPLYYAQDVLLPSLGWHLAWWLRDAFGITAAAFTIGAVLAVALGAALATLPAARPFILAATGTGLLFTAVDTTIGWVPTQPVTLIQEAGSRYSVLPILLLDAALLVAADAFLRRAPRPALRKALPPVLTAGALALVLAVGWVTDFRYPVSRSFARPWSQTATVWLARCHDDPAGSITVANGTWFGKPVPIAVPCSALRG